MKFLAVSLATVFATLGGWLHSKQSEIEVIDVSTCAPCPPGQALAESETTVDAGPLDVLISITVACNDLFVDAWQRARDLTQLAIKIVTDPLALIFAGGVQRVCAALQAQIPPQRMVQLRAATDDFLSNVEGVLREIMAGSTTAANALHSQLSGFASSAVLIFVERHPEHQRILADRDPVAIVGFLVVAALILLWELYCFVRLACFLTRLLLASTSCFCRCCRRPPACVEQSSESYFRAQLELSSTRVKELELQLASKEQPEQIPLQPTRLMVGGA
jgi:hypothetical protein